MTEKHTTNHLDQGKSFPPSGRGAAFLLIIAGLVPGYVIFEEYHTVHVNHLFCLLPILVGVWMNLATTQVYFDQVKEGYLIHQFGVKPFKFTRKTHLNKYDAAILKPARQRYVVAQGIPLGGSINSPEYSISSFGLYFKPKGKFDEELILKGNGKEVIDLTREHLSDTHLRIFMGIVKKGYEVNWD